MVRGTLVLATGARQVSTRPSVDPVQRARTQLGYKNNWHRHNVDLSQQLTWQSPLRDEPVGIIGGGISGLACAQGLSRHGMQAVVFDTGEHSVGGRAATRTTQDSSIRQEWVSPDHSGLSKANLVFDHAAQCFTATDPAFQQQVASWEAAGVVQRWQGAVGTLTPGGVFKPLSPDTPLYVAKGGMRRLAQHMAEQVAIESQGRVEVMQPIWISRMTASQTSGGWQLTGNNKGQGTYGAVVIAHNGKCANRLVGPTGAPRVAQQLMSLRLSAVWALMVVFEGPVPVPGNMEGAFIKGSEVLSWAANNTAKLGVRHPSPYSNIQCWTLISTNRFGQSNKVPQEKVPADVAAKVAREMLQEFAGLLGPAGTKLPKVLFTRCQLWGAALPTNSPGVSCILDPESRVGVCGDWLSGASIQSAVLSGWALAERLAGLRCKGPEAAAQLAIGLETPFKPLKEAEIGEFPGVPKGAVSTGGGRAGGVSCGGNGGSARQQQGQQQKHNRGPRQQRRQQAAHQQVGQAQQQQQQQGSSSGAVQTVPRPQWAAVAGERR